MEHEHEWVNLLWEILEGQESPDRVRLSGDWIIYLTQVLLPELAVYRREQVARLMQEADWDPQRLAETIGSRTEAIKRLAKEGRRTIDQGSTSH